MSFLLNVSRFVGFPFYLKYSRKLFAAVNLLLIVYFGVGVFFSLLSLALKMKQNIFMLNSKIWTRCFIVVDF